MTDLTPNAVVQNLLDLARELASLAADLDTLEVEAVNRREDYTLAYAQAYLRTSQMAEHGKPASIPAREAAAKLDTHNQRLAAETATALVSGRKRQLDVLKVRIEVGRSAAAALRAEYALDSVR